RRRDGNETKNSQGLPKASCRREPAVSERQLHWICFIRFLALAIAPSTSPSKMAVRTISIHGLELAPDMSAKWNVQGVWATANASAVLVSLGSAAKYLFFVRSVREGKLPVLA